MNHNKKNTGNMRRLISIKMVIVTMSIALVMGPVLITRAIMLKSYSAKSNEEMLIEIKSQCNILANSVNPSEKNVSEKDDAKTNAQIEQIGFMYSARVFVINRDFVIVKDSYDDDVGKTIVNKDVISAFRGKTVSVKNDKTGFLYVVIPVYNATNSNIDGVIYVSLTDTQMLKQREYLRGVFSTITLAAFFLSVGIAIFLIIILIFPLRKLSASIKRIADGNKVMHIEGRTLYEYNCIADAVNGAMDRIRTMDDSREEFVSNVSHELKTPMTSMKVLAESLVSQDNVPVEIYREFMEDIISEVDRENQIINDLLEMVRVDRSEAELKVSAVNVNEMVELVLKRLGPIATSRKVSLVLESFRPVAAEIDEVKLNLAITNLVENAIKYNNEGGQVRVAINADARYFYIKVADNGIGIPTDNIEQIFDRFYRVDKARSRETGGTGLGLAITKSIVMLHKGTIRVYSKENEGSTFIVRIPLYYKSTGGDS